MPAIPITLQPASFPNWPTSCPTAPDAAETTKLSPGIGLHISNNPKYAASFQACLERLQRFEWEQL